MTMTIAKAMTKAATETRRNETRMTKGLRISSPLSKSVRVRPTRSSRGTRTWGTVLAVEAERANRWVSERTTRRRPRRRPRPSPWRSTRFDQSRTVASDGSGESKSGGDREEGSRSDDDRGGRIPGGDRSRTGEARIGGDDPRHEYVVLHGSGGNILPDPAETDVRPGQPPVVGRRRRAIHRVHHPLAQRRRGQLLGHLPHHTTTKEEEEGNTSKDTHCLCHVVHLILHMSVHLIL